MAGVQPWMFCTTVPVLMLVPAQPPGVVDSAGLYRVDPGMYASTSLPSLGVAAQLISAPVVPQKFPLVSKLPASNPWRNPSLEPAYTTLSRPCSAVMYCRYVWVLFGLPEFSGDTVVGYRWSLQGAVNGAEGGPTHVGLESTISPRTPSRARYRP